MFRFPTEDDLLKVVEKSVLERYNLVIGSADELAGIAHHYYLKDDECCFYFFCMSAKLCSGYGMWGLGRCYIDRIIVSRNASKALDLFEKSAELNDIGGIMELVCFYTYGYFKDHENKETYKRNPDPTKSIHYATLAYNYFLHKTKLNRREKKIYEQICDISANDTSIDNKRNKN